MAQYMFLLYDDESWYDDLTQDKWDDAMKIHTEFAEAVAAAGARVLGGGALEGSAARATPENRQSMTSDSRSSGKETPNRSKRSL